MLIKLNPYVKTPAIPNAIYCMICWLIVELEYDNFLNNPKNENYINSLLKETN